MRRYRVVISETAQSDLEDIELYIFNQTASIALVSGYTGRIFDRLETIGLAPLGGIARPELGVGIRMVPFEHSAVILYRVLEDHVEIVSIIYGSKDYETAFRPLN